MRRNSVPQCPDSDITPREDHGMKRGGMLNDVVCCFRGGERGFLYLLSSGDGLGAVRSGGSVMESAQRLSREYEVYKRGM